jgi:CheY-like chemotaxis protein
MSERYRVLVVDDEPAVLRAYGRILRGRYDVVLADSGAAALAILAADAGFDAVLCDLQMPGLDGPALYEAAPAALQARFVFASGGASGERAEQFVAEVTCPVLEKPLDRAQLEAALQRVCEPSS